eukprot:CAMPEP_0174848612 /NCGR_PEP_ID=MMETSP1114-20130205/13625_1 /TAXON_ID=312471 /ORGANISM="Neobodo designis, Strain CCAP 1951/1" /LENGTH=528 /DNA_ID=CAMNT_0016082917 /DNA_START=180 /DNA_END=1766 /DNA_ORIENTATION=+
MSAEAGQPTIRSFISDLANRIDCSGKATVAENLATARYIVTTVLKCERASVMLLKPESEALVALADDNQTLFTVAGDSLAARALRENEVLRTKDAANDADYQAAAEGAADKEANRVTRNALTVPVRLAADEATAVVQAFNKDEYTNGGKFSEFDEDKLRLLGQLCSANMLMADIAAQLPTDEQRVLATTFGRKFAPTEREGTTAAFDYANLAIPAPIVRATVMLGEEADIVRLGNTSEPLYESDVCARCNAAHKAARRSGDAEYDHNVLVAPIVPGNHAPLGTVVWAKAREGDNAGDFSDADEALATQVGLLMGLGMAKGWCFEAFPESLIVSASSVARIVPAVDAVAPAQAADSDDDKNDEGTVEVQEYTTDEKVDNPPAEPAPAEASEPAKEEAPAATTAAPEEPAPQQEQQQAPAAPPEQQQQVAVVSTPRRERAAMEALSPYGYDVSHSPITDAQLRIEFEQYDTDGSGKLSKAEFKKKYLSLDWAGLVPSDREFDRTWERYCGADDVLSFDEFCLFMLRRSRM